MFFCCGSKPKIAPKKIPPIRDINTARKYGITLARYQRILALPNMTRGIMEAMFLDGWDFTDTSTDLRLFAGLHSFDLSSIPEYIAEEDQQYEEYEENEENEDHVEENV